MKLIRVLKETTRPESRIITDDFKSKYSSYKLIEPEYNPSYLLNLLKINTYHNSCCRVKATDTVGRGWEFKPNNEDISEEQERLLNEVKKLLDNLETPFITILRLVMMDLEAIGYSAIEIVKKNYNSNERIQGIYHIPAQTIRIHRDRNKYCQIVGNSRRWYKRIEYHKDIDYNTGEEYKENSLVVDKRASEVIFITKNKLGSDYGYPDIVSALPAIYGDVATQKYNNAYFENYGVPSYAVFLTGNFDEGEEDSEGYTEMERAIKEHFKDLVNNPHSTLILSIPSRSGDEVNIRFEKLSNEVKEASFTQFRKDNREEILIAHGVPGYRIGLIEQGSLGGAVAKETNEMYINSIIEPNQELLEYYINRYILKNYGIKEYTFKFKDISIEETSKEIENLNKLFMMGSITPNDIIKNIGAKYGVETYDHPLMKAFYINNEPITYDKVLPSEVEATLLSLQKKILEIAVKKE